MCASPQKENGYTPIANEIAERFCETKHRISGDEWTILWIILRKTYGWNKPEDAIPLSQFAEISGMKRQNVHRALKKLSSKKMITVIKNDDRQPLSISFQKDYEKWVLSSKKITVIKNDDRHVIKIDSNLSSKLIPSKDNTKDNIKTVLAHFNQACKKNLTPTPARVSLIKRCMDAGRTEDQLKTAITNFSKDDWAERHKYIDLVYAIGVIRGIDNFDKWFNQKNASLVNRKAGWTPEEWAAAEKAKDENYLAGKAKA